MSGFAKCSGAISAKNEKDRMAKMKLNIKKANIINTEDLIALNIPDSKFSILGINFNTLKNLKTRKILRVNIKSKLTISIGVNKTTNEGRAINTKEKSKTFHESLKYPFVPKDWILTNASKINNAVNTWSNISRSWPTGLITLKKPWRKIISAFTLMIIIRKISLRNNRLNIFFFLKLVHQFKHLNKTLVSKLLGYWMAAYYQLNAVNLNQI